MGPERGGAAGSRETPGAAAAAGSEGGEEGTFPEPQGSLAALPQTRRPRFETSGLQNRKGISFWYLSKFLLF